MSRLKVKWKNIRDIWASISCSKNFPTLFENGLKFLKSFIIMFSFLYKLMFWTRMIFMFCTGRGCWVARGGLGCLQLEFDIIWCDTTQSFSELAFGASVSKFRIPPSLLLNDCPIQGKNKVNLSVHMSFVSVNLRAKNVCPPPPPPLKILAKPLISVGKLASIPPKKMLSLNVPSPSLYNDKHDQYKYSFHLWEAHNSNWATLTENRSP